MSKKLSKEAKVLFVILVVLIIIGLWYWLYYSMPIGNF